MKNYLRLPLLMVVVVVVLSLLFTYFQIRSKKLATSTGESFCRAGLNTSPGLPTRLIIPAINVSAKVQDLGVMTDGTMDIPSNISDVGWFQYGSRPGESGSAVIAGHLDGKNGEEGVFFNLNKLKKGDTLLVEDDKGSSNIFVVRESRLFNPGYAKEVFMDSGSARLNLVTCDGIWNISKKSYTKRLIVFADMIPRS